MQKQTLRRLALAQRAVLTKNPNQTILMQIIARILAWEPYQMATRIGLYQAMPGEIDLQAIWLASCQRGQRCYFPVVQEQHHTLLFLPANQETIFSQNRYRIKEPQGLTSDVLSPSALDVLFVPLLAFDQKGTRLGMGGGYYDKTLAEARPGLLVGVAYEAQYQPIMESDPWDVRMDRVITECSIHQWSSS